MVVGLLGMVRKGRSRKCMHDENMLCGWCGWESHLRVLHVYLLLSILVSYCLNKYTGRPLLTNSRMLLTSTQQPTITAIGDSNTRTLLKHFY